MIVCSQVGVSALEPDGGYIQAFASVDLTLAEASAILAGIPYPLDRERAIDGPRDSTSAELLSALAGRYKVTLRDKRPVLVKLFQERIVTPCLCHGDAIPYVRDPEAAFSTIVLKRTMASTESFSAIAGEMQFFLELPHDLAFAPTIFAAGRDQCDDAVMARIMAHVDLRWRNVRGYYDFGPYESLRVLVAESVSYTSALHHLEAWDEQACSRNMMFDGNSMPRDLDTILRVSGVEEKEGACRSWTFSPCILTDDPRITIANLLARSALATCVADGDDRCAAQLRSHMLPLAPVLEADSLLPMIFRTPRYAESAECYREIEADRPAPQKPGEIPEPVPGTTWLDHHAFRSRARALDPETNSASVEEAMIRLCANITGFPKKRTRSTPADVRRRFDGGLATLFVPDYASLTYLLQLPPGFSRLSEEVADIDVAVILAHFAEKPFTYVDCPQGSFELGDEVDVKVILAQSAQITRNGPTKALGPESRFTLDAIISRSDSEVEYLLSWHFGTRVATEITYLGCDEGDGALPRTLSDLLQEIGRTQTDVLHQAEQILGRALRLARYRGDGMIFGKLARLEWDDVTRLRNKAHPRRSLFDVVRLPS